MTRLAIIGGAARALDWRPSSRKLAAPHVFVDPSTLRTSHVIAGFPTDYDQSQLNSCGPNALAENYEFRLGGKWSRLFSYWFTRAVERDVANDDGVTIPDLLDVAHTLGMPREEVWPYDIARYQIAPPSGVVGVATEHRVERNDIVGSLDHLLLELDRGQPVLLGFKVPASMEDGAGGGTATTGIVNVPSAVDPPIGGHAVNAIGADCDRKLVRCTCHYGRDFGDPGVPGTILLPFAMWAAGMVSDMRAIRSIT